MRGGVSARPGAVTAALKQLWAAHKFGTKHVSLGVTNPQLVVREMSVANLPAKEMRQALPFQVRDALPLAVERRCSTSTRSRTRASPTVRGLLIAGRRRPC